MKKIAFISIITVFMMITIAFASTVTSNTSKPVRKESPLFGIRARQAIREKIGNMMRRFIGERVFFLPFQWLKNNVVKIGLLTGCNTCGGGFFTCDRTCHFPACTFIKCYPPTHEEICNLH